MVYIVPFDNRDLDKTIRCISRSFTKETMSQALGIGINSYMSFAKIFAMAMQYQLSLVAKDEQSGDVIGFSVLKDFLAWTPHIYHFDPRFIPIGNLIYELEKWYHSKYTVKYGEILHLFMLGVDEKYRGKGIAHQLMEESFNVAKNKGYTRIIAEGTGSITQHICAKYGFKVLKEIQYKTFLYYGQLVFKKIKEPASCKLMLKTFD
jgi:ribosomal protein S18 acetylase RimI-like enzyme